MNWGIQGPTCPLAGNFLKNANVDLSVEGAQAVATLGNRLVRECGDVGMASRRAQEIEMGELGPHVRSTDAMLRNNAELRDRIAKLRTAGALHHSHEPKPHVPRPSGFPYASSRAMRTVGGTREDAEKGMVLLIKSHVAGEGGGGFTSDR